MCFHAGHEKVSRREGAILGHVAVVRRFHVIFHLVWPRELLAADRTRKNLALLALVVEECVSLEGVLVLEGLLNVFFCALSALVDAFCDGGVAKEV